MEHRIDWFDRLSKTIALTVALAGLIIAPYQLGKLTDSIDVSTRILGVAMFSNVANSTLDIDKVFVNHPDLYKYFSSGADLADTEPDYPKARAIGLLLLDYFDHVRPLVLGAEGRHTLSRYIPKAEDFCGCLMAALSGCSVQ